MSLLQFKTLINKTCNLLVKPLSTLNPKNSFSTVAAFSGLVFNTFTNNQRFTLTISKPDVANFYKIVEIIVSALGTKFRVVPEIQRTINDTGQRLCSVVTILVGLKLTAGDATHRNNVIILVNKINNLGGISNLILLFIERFSALPINSKNLLWSIEFEMDKDYIDHLHSLFLDPNAQHQFLATLSSLNSWAKMFGFSNSMLTIDHNVTIPESVTIFDHELKQALICRSNDTQDLLTTGS